MIVLTIELVAQLRFADPDRAINAHEDLALRVGRRA
jgi:hypothetical protein